LNKNYYDAFLKQKMPKNFMIEFKDDDSFVLTTRDKDGKAVKVRLDLRIFPKAMAKNLEVGSGRTEPNNSPYLPPPVGRISFTLNPFKMLAQLVGPEFLAKIYGILCVMVCCVLCIMMLPMLLSNFISTFTLAIFGLN
jgi:hypothetical protein